MLFTKMFSVRLSLIICLYSAATFNTSIALAKIREHSCYRLIQFLVLVPQQQPCLCHHDDCMLTDDTTVRAPKLQYSIEFIVF